METICNNKKQIETICGKKIGIVLPLQIEELLKRKAKQNFRSLNMQIVFELANLSSETETNSPNI